MKENYTYSMAINEALDELMEENSSVYVMGLGVDDYKSIWGTTGNLLEKYGKKRVFDVPISENGFTGMAVGSAISGLRPIIVHQRIDFSLISMDAIINQALKIESMSGYTQKCPITFRMIVGRGWGQSVQHAQFFYPIFTHFPGVKVVVPYSVNDAKELLKQAVYDDEPVIVIEARELYSKKSDKIEEKYKDNKLGKAQVIKEGEDLTIISFSYMVSEVLKSVELFEKQSDKSCEIIDLRTIKPLDFETILKSVNKTKRVLLVDTSWSYGSISHDISHKIQKEMFGELKSPVEVMTLPEKYVGVSTEMEEEYYINSKNIEIKISNILR